MFLFFKTASTVLISSLMSALISLVQGSYSSFLSPDLLKFPSFWPSTQSRRSSDTFRPRTWIMPFSWENRSLFRFSKWTTWTLFPQFNQSSVWEAHHGAQFFTNSGHSAGQSKDTIRYNQTNDQSSISSYNIYCTYIYLSSLCAFIQLFFFTLISSNILVLLEYWIIDLFVMVNISSLSILNTIQKANL